MARKHGVSDAELAKRLMKHLIQGGIPEEEAAEKAGIYYKSHGVTFSQQELDNRASKKPTQEAEVKQEDVLLPTD